MSRTILPADKHRILLGPRPLGGRHTGTSLADEVCDTLAFWQIDDLDRVSYFTLDNAANNDTCMENIAFELGFCATERRIRCAAHILNLSVRAMLCGSKGENLTVVVSADGDDDEDEEEVNRVIDEALGGEMLNDEIGFELDALDPIEDCYSSHLALKEITNATFREYSLRGAPVRLSPYVWKVVEILVKLLKPFEVATKQLQGSGMPRTRFTCGSLDEYFPVIKILLDHLENAIEGIVYEEIEDPGTKERKDIETAILDGLDSKTRKLLKLLIELGWKKLHNYYDLLTSAAYVGAVVFNPTKKWRLLDLLWSRVPSRKAKSWRQDYEYKLLQIWERYKDREVDCEVVPMPKDVSMDYIERRLARSIA
ncbi:hypothetical protein MY4038_007668 [Beauveria bassiana]